MGKYPPIQGGVSAQTYWAARGLAERGHEVFVVTNADEVEDTYRIDLDGCDPADYAPTFPNGGMVRVYGLDPADRRISHIPQSNPFVSRLAGLAAQVVREHGCERIVASYLEPYGVAGHLAATWTGVPLLVRHAGSDVDRLMRLPELAVTYREVLRAATAVITPRATTGRMLALGVAADALRSAPLLAVPTVAFNPTAEPLTPAEVERLARLLPYRGGSDRVFDPSRPTVGIYGKPGETKGTYDLLAAAALLRADGLDFNLLMLTGPSHAGRIEPLLADGRLADRTFVLPFLPHWRVPRFIRTCTAVCFLERDFPIAIHGPTIPREVLACGTCLVLSDEIYRKQSYRDDLVDGTNVVLVPDPKDRPALAARLRPLLDKPALAIEIGARGRLVTAHLDRFDRFVDSWEALVSLAPPPSPDTVDDPVGRLLPWARPVLGDAAVDRFRPAPGTTDEELVAGFCDFLVAAPPAGIDPNLVGDLVCYQRARRWAARHDDDGLPYPMRALGPTPGEDRPRLAAPVRVERFHYDVVPLFCRTGQGPDEAARLPARRPTTVCFARLPNLTRSETRVSEDMATLLDLCDGRRSVAQIAVALGVGGTARTATVEAAVAQALRRLRDAGLVSLGKGGET